MKRLIFAAAFFASTSALADPPKEYTLTMSPADVNIIGTALGQRPFAEVKDLWGRLEAQIVAQNQPPKTPEPPKADDTPKQ